MTTDELVAKVIAALKDQDIDTLEVLNEHHRLVTQDYVGTLIFETYSVALNDETRDIRYVQSVYCVLDEGDFKGDAYEVSPVTVLRTEYRRK